MTETLFNWEHATMMIGILTPFALFWMDSRRQSSQQHRELMKQQQQMHIENLERFAALEVKIEPLWTWWNARIRGLSL